MKKLTLIIALSFILQAACLGAPSVYAEVEPFDLNEVLDLEDSIPLNSQKAQDRMEDAFQRSNGAADAYTWDASGLNDYGYDPYALDYELSGAGGDLFGDPPGIKDAPFDLLFDEQFGIVYDPVSGDAYTDEGAPLEEGLGDFLYDGGNIWGNSGYGSDYVFYENDPIGGFEPLTEAEFDEAFPDAGNTLRAFLDGTETDNSAIATGDIKYMFGPEPMPIPEEAPAILDSLPPPSAELIASDPFIGGQSDFGYDVKNNANPTVWGYMREPEAEPVGENDAEYFFPDQFWEGLGQEKGNPVPIDRETGSSDTDSVKNLQPLIVDKNDTLEEGEAVLAAAFSNNEAKLAYQAIGPSQSGAGLYLDPFKYDMERHLSKYSGLLDLPMSATIESGNPQKDPSEIDWSSSIEHRPTVIYPQDKVAPEYVPGADSPLADFLPYTDESRPVRPYVGTGRMLEVAAGHSGDEVVTTHNFIHGSGADSLRYGVAKAMEAQGYTWTEESDLAGKNLFLDHLDKYRLPSIGEVDEKGGGYNKYAIDDGRPQIEIGRNQPKEFTPGVIDGGFPVNAAAILAHEYAHSSQALPSEYIDSDGKLKIDSEKEFDTIWALPETWGLSVMRRTGEVPAVTGEVGMYAGMHRAQTDNELEGTIVFPSGKEMTFPFIEQEMRERHVFSPDPETGTTNDITALMSTPEGLQWLDGIYGTGTGGVMVTPEDIHGPSFTDKGMEVLKGNESAEEFLRNLGIDFKD